MKFKKISISGECYFNCQSQFYSALNCLEPENTFVLENGINFFVGSIDSGAWSISYLLSAYDKKQSETVLTKEPSILIDDNETMSLSQLMRYSCYMDASNLLFKSKKTVKELVEKAIKKNCISSTSEEIRDLFEISECRYDRRISQVGNDIFKAMAAIGYCCKKEIFCFPWISKKRFEYYQMNLIYVLEILAKLDKVVVVPIEEHIDYFTKDSDTKVD